MYSPLPDPMHLISLAWREIKNCAHEVGIDGQALIHQWPAPGQLLRGEHVPVLEPRDRWRCYMIFYINHTRNGQEWPFIVFGTFRHGGHVTRFNGLKWWLENPRNANGGKTLPTAHSPNISMNAFQNDLSRSRANEVRSHRFHRWQKRWHSAPVLAPDHPWIRTRLSDQATALLLNRADIRVSQEQGDHVLMAPLVRSDAVQTGFQVVHMSHDHTKSDKKRIYVKADGMMKHSYILIRNIDTAPFFPIGICEGLATGLSVALEWPGEIRVALSAGNLASVRQGCPGPCVFFYDQDLWKSHVGNVGRTRAFAAAQPGDLLLGPHFKAENHAHHPTDFNDLLMLEGRHSLKSHFRK